MEALAGVRLDDVLRLAELQKASDVHLYPGALPMLRVDGVLRPSGATVVSALETGHLAAALLDAGQRARFDSQGDVTVVRRQPHVRAHVYRCSAGTAIALRRFHGEIPAIESLRVPPAVVRLCELTHGLVLVAGPTGSGKSTLLAAMIDRINRTHARHLLTLEDPVEFVHASKRSLICHREVGLDVPSFAAGVYGALRSDPDVLLIGELRDAQTIEAAITAAETGHLVLATIHTGDAVQTVDRVIGSFEGHMQEQVRISLSQTLAAAICTRLVPLEGGGRRACVEVLIATDAVRNVIREAKPHLMRNVIATSRHAGMQTLEHALDDLVAAGEISIETARAAAARPSDLREAALR